jgi:hypothetical protein
MEPHEWTKQVDRLNANFHGQELRPETAVGWYEEGDLADRPTWLVSLAVQRIIRTHDYPPRSVAGLLRTVEEVRGQLAHEQAEDATRTCPGCCTQDIPGWIEAVGGFHPCPDCRPGRHQAWEQTRASNWPLSKTGRNYMAAPFDKATGYIKSRERPA